RVHRLKQRALQVSLPATVVCRALGPREVDGGIETGELAKAVGVAGVGARSQPRAEDRAGQARVQLVHDRHRVALLVAAAAAAIPSMGPGNAGSPERVLRPALQDA